MSQRPYGTAQGICASAPVLYTANGKHILYCKAHTRTYSTVTPGRCIVRARAALLAGSAGVQRPRPLHVTNIRTTFINLRQLPVCVTGPTSWNKADFRGAWMGGEHVHTCYLFCHRKGGDSFTAPPPPPLFTASALHISSIIRFYGTHRMIIMITIITTHIKYPLLRLGV